MLILPVIAFRGSFILVVGFFADGFHLPSVVVAIFAVYRYRGGVEVCKKAQQHGAFLSSPRTHPHTCTHVLFRACRPTWERGCARASGRTKSWLRFTSGLTVGRVERGAGESYPPLCRCQCTVISLLTFHHSLDCVDALPLSVYSDLSCYWEA